MFPHAARAGGDKQSVANLHLFCCQVASLLTMMIVSVQNSMQAHGKEGFGSAESGKHW